MAESAWLQYMSSAFDWSNSTCQPCLTLNWQMVQMSAWWLRFLSWLQAKAHLHLNLFGEYFQFIRMLVKHCGLNRKNTNKEDCRAESEQGEEWGTKKFSLSWRGYTMTWFPNVQWASWAGAPPHWEKKLLEFTNTHEDGKSIRFELLSALLHSNLCCSRLTIFCRSLSEQFCQRRPLAFLLTRSTPGCRYIQGLQHC